MTGSASPGVYNPDQADSDGNGVGDACSSSAIWSVRLEISATKAVTDGDVSTGTETASETYGVGGAGVIVNNGVIVLNFHGVEGAATYHSGFSGVASGPCVLGDDDVGIGLLSSPGNPPSGVVEGEGTLLPGTTDDYSVRLVGQMVVPGTLTSVHSDSCMGDRTETMAVLFPHSQLLYPDSLGTVVMHLGSPGRIAVNVPLAGANGWSGRMSLILQHP